MWEDIFPRLVDGKYRVIMYDRRGFGRSEGGDDFLAFHLSDGYRQSSVDELCMIKKPLDIGPYHLIGQYDGGVIITVDYAGRYPDDVLSVTVASTQCYGEVPMIQLKKERLTSYFWDLEEGLQMKMIDWHGEMAKIKYNQFAKHGGEYGAGYFDLRDSLPEVLCPALVLYPDRSSVFPVEQALAFYRGLPRGELSISPPHCGHNAYEQKPDDYIRTILDFLVRIGETEKRERPSMACLE